jgi:hypothetical protein
MRFAFSSANHMLPSGPAVIHCGSELGVGIGYSANEPELVPEPLVVVPELPLDPLEPEDDPPLELDPEPVLEPVPEPLAPPLLLPEPHPEPTHASPPASAAGRRSPRPSTRSHAAAAAAHARKAVALIHGRSLRALRASEPPSRSFIDRSL